MKDKLRGARTLVVRARGLLSTGRIEEAEEAARRAVSALEGDESDALLFEALTLLGTARARSLRAEAARASFRRAAELAEEAGDNEAAGRASLSHLEELAGQMSAGEMRETYLRADRLLADSPHRETLARLRRCASLVVGAVDKEARSE
jgi:tetratricopeptide (TPR) repeat protein